MKNNLRVLPLFIVVSFMTLFLSFISCQMDANGKANEQINDFEVNAHAQRIPQDFRTSQFHLRNYMKNQPNEIPFHNLNVAHNISYTAIAGCQTTLDPEPVITRLNLNGSSATVRFQEEQSYDQEIGHDHDVFGVLTLTKSGPRQQIVDWKGRRIGEIITISNVEQTQNNQIHHAYYDGFYYPGPGHQYYNDPVVIGCITTDNEDDPAWIRVLDIDGWSIDYTIEEWEYMDGVHKPVNITFLVIERGSHVISDENGFDLYVLEAGKIELTEDPSKNETNQTINLLTNFDRIPFVFGLLEGDPSKNPPAIARINSIDISGADDHFKAQLQYEENNMVQGRANNGGQLLNYMVFGRVGDRNRHRSNVVSQNGWLSVNDNNQLVNQNGSPIQLKGMSSFWINWPEGAKYANEETIDWLVRDWEIDVYRIAVGVNPYDGREFLLKDPNTNDYYPDVYEEITDSTPDDTRKFLLDNHPNPDVGKACEYPGVAYVGNEYEVTKKVKELIDACVERGIYVIVDWHVHDGISNEDAAANFFGQIASAYPNTPNIIYEIWNEPSMKDNDILAANKSSQYVEYIYQWTNTSGDNWANYNNGVIKTYCERMLSLFRLELENKNIIICPSGNFDQYIHEVAREPIDNPWWDYKILYALHFYAGTTEDWSIRTTPNNYTYQFHYPDAQNRRSAYSLMNTYRDYQTPDSKKKDYDGRSYFDIPIFVTEWGTSEFDGGQNPVAHYTAPQSIRYMQLMEKLKISWCNWAVTDKDEGASALKPGACEIGFWSNYGLTPSGRLIRTWIRDEQYQ